MCPPPRARGTRCLSRVKFRARQQQLRVVPFALIAQGEFPNAAVVRFYARHLPKVRGVSDDSYDRLLSIQEPLDEPLDAGNDRRGADVLLDAPLIELGVLYDYDGLLVREES